MENPCVDRCNGSGRAGLEVVVAYGENALGLKSPKMGPKLVACIVWRYVAPTGVFALLFFGTPFEQFGAIFSPCSPLIGHFRPVKGSLPNMTNDLRAARGDPLIIPTPTVYHSFGGARVLLFDDKPLPRMTPIFPKKPFSPNFQIYETTPIFSQRIVIL